MSSRRELRQSRKRGVATAPTVLWCEIDRLCSHTSSDDQRLYRPAEDLALDATRDPIGLLATKLIAEGALTEAEWAAEQVEIAKIVDEDYRGRASRPIPRPTRSRT